MLFKIAPGISSIASAAFKVAFAAAISLIQASSSVNSLITSPFSSKILLPSTLAFSPYTDFAKFSFSLLNSSSLLPLAYSCNFAFSSSS
jgi:hypothetical protein